MRRERLQLALERIKPNQWHIFEEFAAQFHIGQYPNLRTVASSSGDKGRDGEIFSPFDQTPVLLQYSVSADWRKKIMDTIKRINRNFLRANLLIYVTNQSILSAADSLKIILMKDFNIALDIHDMNWFLDRLDNDSYRQAAAERLAEVIVDPFLASKGVLAHSAPALTTPEYQAALTFLQLQWEDDTRNKGLTKLSFDALVRTILRDTGIERRISRSEVYRRMRDLLPNHNEMQLQQLVDSALSRLNKRYIRHWTKDDEFCLTHDETIRVRERLAAIEMANAELDKRILSIAPSSNLSARERELFCSVSRLAINKFLLQRAELFASAITNDRTSSLKFDDLQVAIKEAINDEMHDIRQDRKQYFLEEIFLSVRRILVDPPPLVQSNLRAKADAYTILSFLGHTPDVQAAVTKMFSHGMIWLDTTIVLPLFAETLIQDGNRRFTQMVKVATASGLKLKITPGVIEEVERHMNQCLIYARNGHERWSGRVPFLVEAYLRSGRGVSTVASWIESFEGTARPEDDLAEYLEEFFDIERESLEEYVLDAAEELRHIVQEAWASAHDRRRAKGERELDEIALLRLVRHDVENYLGVVERRRDEKVSPLGYSTWWLSLDRVAGQVDQRLRDELGREAPATPLMSADFLVNYLSVGPNRARIGKEREALLPILLDVDMYDELPADLLVEAERIRRDSDGLPEHVIRRRVRDHLDAAKRRRGRVTEEGVEVVLSEIGI